MIRRNHSALAIRIYLSILAVFFTLMFCPVDLRAASDTPNNTSAGSFIISNIQVEGLHRISLGTVLNYVPVKVGDTMNQAREAETLRELYDTGFFQNVALARSGNVLIIEIVERPTIGEITVTGNSDITTEQLNAVLTQIGIVKGQVFRPAAFEQFQKQLTQEYNNRGKYNATISTDVTPLSENRVAIKIDISEGRSARIKEINIIGNHAFDDSTLLKQFSLTTMGFFTYFTKEDQYNKEAMNASMESLRSYYMDRGYVRFHIDSTQVLLSPDKKYVYIDVKITEGAKYTFAGYKLIGKLILPEEDLEKLVQFKKGDTFSRKKITQTVTQMTDAYGNIGYGFPKIDPATEINDEDKTVFVNFIIHPGRHVYVRRITFTGNTKTGDYVLRHAIKQDEGGLLTSENIKESERQLRILGYLKNVSVQTVKVPESNNQVDMNVSVEEAPSAEASVSLGYGSNGPELNASIDQHNWMGTGREVGVHFNTSFYSTNYSVNYYNPFYTDSGIGRGFTAYYSHIDPSNLDLANYTSDKVGGDVNYNIPLTNKSSFQTGYGFQHVSINSVGSPSVTQIQNFVDEYGYDFNEVRLKAAWGRNSYDQKIFPTSGTNNQISLMTAFPATSNSLSYYKSGYSFHGYQPLFKGFILTGATTVAYGNSFNNQGLPFFENSFAGGIVQPGEIRGYENYSIGPQDSNGNSYGGNLLTVGSVGIILPYPISQPSFRTTAFMDAGNVYGYGLPEDQQGTDSGPVRLSAGMAVDWRSPMGPLTFSLATPLNEQPGDVSNPFQFSVTSML